MHSSRICTAYSLLSRGSLSRGSLSGGLCPGGSLSRRSLSGGAALSREGHCDADPTFMNRMTDRQV